MELTALTTYAERIDVQLQRVQEALALMQEKEETSDGALAVVRKVMKETRDSFKSEFDAWGEGLRKSHQDMCRDVENNYALGCSNIENALKAAGSLVEVMVREAQTYMESERKSVLQANAIAESTVNNEVTRLRQQNEILAILLETERARGNKAKDELIQRVSNLLGDFTQERDTALTESIAAIQGSNVKGGETMRSFGDGLTQLTSGMSRRSEKAIGVLEKRSGEGKRTRDGALKVMAFLVVMSMRYLLTHWTVYGRGNGNIFRRFDQDSWFNFELNKDPIDSNFQADTGCECYLH